MKRGVLYMYMYCVSLRDGSAIQASEAQGFEPGETNIQQHGRGGYITRSRILSFIEIHSNNRHHASGSECHKIARVVLHRSWSARTRIEEVDPRSNPLVHCANYDYPIVPKVLSVLETFKHGPSEPEGLPVRGTTNFTAMLAQMESMADLNSLTSHNTPQKIFHCAPHFNLSVPTPNPAVDIEQSRRDTPISSTNHLRTSDCVAYSTNST
jgi:hypothetical protein